MAGGGPRHRAVFIATAQPGDDEMRERIARHQRDRAIRLPAWPRWRFLWRWPGPLPAAPGRHAAGGGLPHALAHHLLMPLRLRNWKIQLQPAWNPDEAQIAFDSGSRRSGPVVLVSNEIGLGVIAAGSRGARLCGRRWASSTRQVAAGVPAASPSDGGRPAAGAEGGA